MRGKCFRNGSYPQPILVGQVAHSFFAPPVSVSSLGREPSTDPFVCYLIYPCHACTPFPIRADPHSAGQVSHSFMLRLSLASHLTHIRYQHLGGHPRFQVSKNRQVLPWARGLSLCLESIYGTIEPDVSSLPMAATAGLYVRHCPTFGSS